MNNEIIFASEFSDYEFCSKSWFLKRSGIKPISEKLNEGKEVHEQIGKTSTDKTIREKYGLKEGGIIYSDLDKPTEPIFSNSLKIAGKPDFIVKNGNLYIPIEIKTTIADLPYKGHILQLTAYCILVEEKFSTKVEFGIIEYGNGKQYKINFDYNLQFELWKMLKEMRNALKLGRVERNHNSENRCAVCSVREFCDKQL